MNKRDAGRLGGKATLAKHGKKHFSRIGKRGAQTFHKLYRLDPYGIGDFAIVDRQTNQIVGYLSGAKLRE